MVAAIARGNVIANALIPQSVHLEPKRSVSQKFLENLLKIALLSQQILKEEFCRRMTETKKASKKDSSASARFCLGDPSPTLQ